MRACFESEAGIYNYPEWQLNMDIVSRFLMVINSSINIVIYCWSGKQFKAVLVSIVTKNEVDYQVCNSVCICIKLSQYHCHYNVYIWKKKKNFKSFSPQGQPGEYFPYQEVVT